MRYTTTADIKRGRLYAGPALPEGAEIIGTITREDKDTGALLRLANGVTVQYNAGVIRNLPRDFGRPKIADSSTGRNIRIDDTIWQQIPEPRSEWIREAIRMRLES